MADLHVPAMSKLCASQLHACTITRCRANTCAGMTLQCCGPGECFCLLGPNGAGKSTTINCLIGLLPMTAGDALVHGSSIRDANGLAGARGVMGVCPQFDVLWGHLTGREHLLLFGAIKGLQREQAEQQADALLDQVGRFCNMTWNVSHGFRMLCLGIEQGLLRAT